MKFVFAPDSFKGTLSALRICEMLESAAKAQYGPEIETCRAPLADGGEGTVDALLAARGGERLFAEVTGPYGKPTKAGYARLAGGEYVMEMAQASGLALSENRDPLLASSEGTGELLREILDRGAKKILIGIGGSATNDGGAGFLHALGATFTDGSGRRFEPKGGTLSNIASVDIGALHPALRKAELEVVCDVTNPLCGPEGATAIYGPQKGATEKTVPLLEAGMLSYKRVLEVSLGKSVDFPGAGAAGGMGAALGAVLGAKMRSGVDAVLEYAGFDGMLKGAALCVTGEGRLDGQSVRYGKAVSGIARRCAKADVPLAVIAGGLGEGAREIYGVCPCALLVTPDRPMPLSEALENAEPLFADAADRLFRTLRIGERIARYAKP